MLLNLYLGLSLLVLTLVLMFGKKGSILFYEPDELTIRKFSITVSILQFC